MEIKVDRYNAFCDKLRSAVMYAESIKKKNEKRRMIIQDMTEVIYRSEMELVRRVELLEKSINLIHDKMNNENNPKEHNHPS